MLKEISVLEDTIGEKYLGCSFLHSELKIHLKRFQILEPNFEEYLFNRIYRDGLNYHMTIMNTSECRKSIDFLKYENETLDVELLGVGKVSDLKSTAYFIVCESQIAQDIRKTFNLSEKDLHITLGFDPKDVFKSRKNEVI